MLCRYVFTAYNLKDAERADETEVAVYATNEGEALHKASQVAVRAHYKPEAVEEMPSGDGDMSASLHPDCQECDAFQACMSSPAKCDSRGNDRQGEDAADDVPPAACRNCDGDGECGSTPDKCDVLHPDAEAEVSAPAGHEESGG